MGLEVVVNEIIEQGRQQASGIEKEGLKEATQILTEAKQRAENTLAERKAEAERDAERLKVQEIARAEFEAKKKVLTAQRELLSRIKGEALTALDQLDEGARRGYYQKLIAHAESQMPGGTVRCTRADEATIKDLTSLTVVGDLDGAGGIVVDAPDGAMRLDLRFEALLEEAWPAILRTETKELFA